jgi:hypothetical protein
MDEYIINTIQEITMQAYAFGVYDYLFNERNMSRTDIFALFVEWAKEFEETHKDFDWSQASFYDEVDDFVSYRLDSFKAEDLRKNAFPYGIAIGDHISYKDGIFKITGFTNRGILVEEVKPCPESPEWITLEIGYSQCDKVKILEDYEEIMDTANSHNPELVAKINIAWNEKREMFFPIMCALYKRDVEEIMNSEAFTFPWEHGYTAEDVYLYLAECWDVEVYNYLQHIADDTDLECILNFLHAQ